MVPYTKRFEIKYFINEEQESFRLIHSSGNSLQSPNQAYLLYKSPITLTLHVNLKLKVTSNTHPFSCLNLTPPVPVYPLLAIARI